KEYDIDRIAMDVMIDRHGAEALKLITEGRHVANYTASSEDKVWAFEAVHAIKHTMCRGLIDFYVRRSPLFLARHDHGLGLLALISKVFAKELGWSDSKRQEESAAIQAYVKHELAWKLKFGISPSSV
ncbi:MAG: glycerol-3-phosphate dehydrogenase C-terminal domain-containing protein, partial [Bdellovibrionota bacterium]